MTLSISNKSQAEAVNRPVIIDIKDLSLRYSSQDLNVLDYIDLQLYEKDFVCVLGPSGCGKSSLLNVIAGFQKQSTGEVMMNGKTRKKPNADIGVVFQHHNLFPWLSIEKNVAFGLKMKGVPKKARKQTVSYYLELVGLSAAAKKLPYQVSGGMKQRAAIARTLITDPKVILMDEPFSALDAITRVSMQNHLLEIWRKTKKCIFFITHDVEEALLLGTRIVVMQSNPGRVIVDMQNPLIRQNKPIESIKREKEFNKWSDYLLSCISDTESEIEA
ncbi:ABC transporter ATP-binding protein [Heyndrickxia ginsengihumi]|uniref:ABC transporter ATP-binding protein n=1 Tax=Heyndrickxia ginsengihumi TaxID=363870 RepID=A0A0A6V8R5_9BACI|nr:ABC transporter ATP-binding protein [Heyndrickxia ginsengihumi]KHD84450.1 taurine ABC transporter ATP-binding protein [Heyndrickxia ginsengihumi]MBE6185244.1 ABC transporter ATP-binding protein [Bacillus sp. (in: firmicutes)]NEY21678.1 ABC transporter ATP-binding protein [Heyndrickxia ginsengihumi]